MRDLGAALRSESITVPEVRTENLDSFMKRVNLRLAEAHANRRIFPVETQGDDSLYLVCEPSAEGRLKALGLTAIALP